MKKILLFSMIVFGFVAARVERAEAQEFSQGDIVGNLGIGLGGGLGLPFSISGEYGYSDKIGIGGFLGYASEKENLGFFDAKYSYLLLGARGNYHFDLGIDKLDPYVGLMLGYNVASVSLDPDPGPPFNNISAGGVLFGGHAGARYYITDKIGAFGEVGYGLGLLTIGVTMKL